MNDKITPEVANDLIALLKEFPRHTWVASPSAWIYELQNNPKHFYRNDKGELMWLGCKVVPIRGFSGNDDKVWALADKIIPKENKNEN